MTCKDWRECYIQLAEAYYQATGAIAPPPVNPQTGRPLKIVIVSPERLRQLYIDQELSTREIGELFGCSPSTVSGLLRRFDIPARPAGSHRATEAQRTQARELAQRNTGRTVSQETRRKISEATRDRSGEFGGREFRDRNGYIRVYKPEHPYAAKDGTVAKHRLVMERHLERYLEPHEVVHHINHIRDDNRLENLELMDWDAHNRMHGRESGFGRKKECIL